MRLPLITSPAVALVRGDQEVGARPAARCDLAGVTVVACLLLVLVNAFEWSLIELLTPFLFPFLQLGVRLVFLGCGAWALGAAIWNRRRGYPAAAPLLLCILVAIFVRVTPFTALWLEANYRWYRSDRERIVRQVQAGASALEPGASYATVRGHEVVVEQHDGRRYVFFYAFRGILDNYSGFLFVPEGGSPALFADLGEADSTQLKRIDAQWYFAAHW